MSDICHNGMEFVYQAFYIVDIITAFFKLRPGSFRIFLTDPGAADSL